MTKSIRAIPFEKPKPESELVSLEEAAERLGVSPDTVRRWIKADMADGKGRVPGGRFDGRYAIIRAVFDRAMRHGIEPERTPIVIAPEISQIVSQMRRQAMETLEYAAELEAAAIATRRQTA